MATNILQNDFTSGIVGVTLYGKTNTQVYQNGCMDMKNFSIIPQGGAAKRPGTTMKNTPDHSQTSARTIKGTRLIPFVIKDDTTFILEIGKPEGTQGDSFIRVWIHDAENLLTFNISGTQYTELTPALVGFSLWTNAEAKDIQYAQDYEHLFLVHRNYKPVMVTYSTENQGGTIVPKLTFSQITPTLQTNDTENTGLFTGDECPGVVMYYASRLWFASSNNHPYRIWASRPFDITNFEFWDIEQVVDETITSQTIEDAIRNGEFTKTDTEVISTLNEATWREENLPSGTYTFVFNGSVWTLNSQSVNIADYGLSVQTLPSSGATIEIVYYNINEVAYANEDVYREDSAILLEVGSNRNDKICWMNSMGNYIVVGTSSGEWLMNGAINGLTQNIYQASAYGSENIQSVQAGNDLIFIQKGGQSARAFAGSSEGFASPNLNFYSRSLSGAKRIVWQSIPSPTLYVMTESGVNVLFYDRQYNLMGWSQWDFNGQKFVQEVDTAESTSRLLDMCVCDSSDGQSLYLLIKRTEGSTSNVYLERMDAPDIYNYSAFVADCKWENTSTHKKNYYQFNAALLTRAYDTTSGKGATMGTPRRIYRAIARVMSSPSIRIGYQYTLSGIDDRYMQTKQANNQEFDDIEVTIPGGYEKFIAIGIESNNTENMAVLGLSMQTEVS